MTAGLHIDLLYFGLHLNNAKYIFICNAKRIIYLAGFCNHHTSYKWYNVLVLTENKSIQLIEITDSYHHQKFDGIRLTVACSIFFSQVLTYNHFESLVKIKLKKIKICQQIVSKPIFQFN